MEFCKLELEGVILVKPKIFSDERGYFMETYHEEKFSKNFGDGKAPSFVQDNHACSSRNVIRGLHFQVSEPQGKLVRCILGRILDVAVDIRPDSPTYGHYVSQVLSEHNNYQLWIPAGFAHGYASLGAHNEVLYKCDGLYNPGDEGGIVWDCPKLDIDWGVDSPVVSDKDKKLPGFLEL